MKKKRENDNFLDCLANTNIRVICSLLQMILVYVN